MNNFASVATDILLANNAVVNKGLTLGTSSDTESTAFIRSANKTSLSSGTGFYIENTGNFNIGDASNYVDWDGSKLSVLGKITSTEGEIGGWTIDEDSIYVGTKVVSGNYTTTGITIGSDGHISSKEFRIDADGNAYFRGDISAATGTISNSIKIGSGESVFIANSNGIFLGNETFANAEFSVTPAGYLKSTSGKIGGYTIGANSLTAGTTNATAVGISNNGQAFWAGHLTSTSAPFRVTQAGALTATNATITGAINAKSGTIGNEKPWTIGGDENRGWIHNGRTNLTTGAAGIYIGTNGIALGANVATPEFSVTPTGVLNATSATIEGTITATGGSFTGDLTVGSSLILNTDGSIYTGSKDSYTDDAVAGFWLGYDSGAYKLNIGDDENFLKWNGDLLSVKGDLQVISTYYILQKDDASSNTTDIYVDNISYNGTDYATHFPITITTGTITSSQAGAKWVVLFKYTGLAVPYSGASLPSSPYNGWDVGDVLFWQEKSSYHQLQLTQSDYTLSATIGSTTHTLAVLGSGIYRRIPNQTISYEVATDVYIGFNIFKWLGFKFFFATEQNYRHRSRCSK